MLLLFLFVLLLLLLLLSLLLLLVLFVVGVGLLFLSLLLLFVLLLLLLFLLFLLLLLFCPGSPLFMIVLLNHDDSLIKDRPLLKHPLRLQNRNLLKFAHIEAPLLSLPQAKIFLMYFSAKPPETFFSKIP